MIVPDSSVLVAGFVVEHRFHDAAASAVANVRSGGRLVAHTMAETYSVLSAPGGAYRAEPGLVIDYLDELLERSAPIQPRPNSYREALGLLAGAGQGGASVYDALIALAARDAGATLISLDRRATPTYEQCGVVVKFLGDG
ncbi:MAG TPA: PIN domain-containing protein [Solirubrobacterales bacterium]|nr:PIN domain-containing protein [Solirubrobacterales bacterium]